MVATLLCSIAVRAEGATALPQMSTDLENPVFYTISNTRSTSGKYLYYAGDNVGLRDANDITLASLFYFTGTAEACYIHNAATTKKVASVTSWTDAGIEWTIGVTPYGDGTTGLCICPKGNEQSFGYWNEFTYNDGYTTYAANDAGSVFVIEPYTGTYPPEAPEVKPSISSLADAAPTKCYTISTVGRGAWAVDMDGTRFSTTGVEGFAVDAADARQQFAILSANTQDYYLYSVSAKKFVKQDRSLVVGAGDAIEFVDASSQGVGRVMVRFRDITNANINIGGDNQMVINSWGIIDAGNAVLIAVADDFDASEALAQLADPEAAEVNALIARVEALVEANAANHAVEPALGQYSTAAYEALAAAVGADSVSKASLEAAIAAFEAAKCLPVFSVDGVYGYGPGMSIYELDAVLHWKETDRTDESMLWTFDMTDTVVGVTDRVVVRNLATGNYFDNAFFVKVTETEEAIADDGLFLIYPEGMGFPLCAWEGGRINRGEMWSANSISAWKFTYTGTTYKLNIVPENPDTPEVSGVVSSLADADPTKCYAVSTTTRGAWAVDAEGTVFSATGAMGLDVDAADAHQQFAILSANDEDYYLYSVSAGKFVKSDGSLVSFVGDAIEFADASSMGEGRVQVRFKDIAKGYINLNNYGQMTIDGWNTVDEGNAVLIAEAGDFDATEALAILADPEGARLTVLLAQAQELLAANANKHAAEPALGQYATDAYENLAATVNSDSVSVAALEYFIAAFEASKCLPVFTIDGVNDYAAGMSVYDGGGQFPNWKATDRTDESMLWVFDMTETTVGVTDKVVVKNYATGNLLMGADFIQVAETSENIADDGLFLIFCEEDTQFSVWASQSGIVVRAQEIFSASSTAAWKFTYAGTTYGIEDAPVGPETPSGPVTSLSAADPTKCYTISTTTRGAWAVNDAGTYFSTTGVEGYEVDADDARQQFAILSANGEDYYLYSVSAKKFVKCDRSLVTGVADALEFVDASSKGEGRVMVRFRDFLNSNINIGGDNQMVINGWNLIDEGNAVLIAEAGNFDAAEALAILTNPEEAERNALIAQALELLEANADNHAVEPALGQYATRTYEYLDSVANSEEVTKDVIEDAIYLFEASKCLPVFTINGVAEFAAGKSIYEFNGRLYWKATDRTDESMLWMFDMTDTVVGVTDMVVVKNLATGRLFDNALFVQVAEPQDGAEGYWICPEGLGVPMFAYEDGRVERAYSWTSDSPHTWEFVYAGTTYDINELPSEPDTPDTPVVPDTTIAATLPLRYMAGENGWIEGTEWIDEELGVVGYASPLYVFEEKVETFRIIVKRAQSGEKFFSLSELGFFDADGNKIELTEDNVTSNADHNTLNPDAPDGGGIAALFDEDVTTYFHSAWQNIPEGDHYLEVTLPNGGYDAFSFEMLSRGRQGGYDQTRTFPSEMVITDAIQYELLDALYGTTGDVNLCPFPEVGYYYDDLNYIEEAFSNTYELLVNNGSEAECEAMIAELTQALERYRSMEVRLPDPDKGYRVISAFPAFAEHQLVEKAITINPENNALWWEDVCADNEMQEFIFEPVLDESGQHLSWVMDINYGGSVVTEKQYFYNMKNAATGLYVSYSSEANFHLVDQPCTVYLAPLGGGQFGIRFRIANEYGGGTIYTMHAGDHNGGLPSDREGAYGGTSGMSSGIVNWYAGDHSASAWFIRETHELPYTMPVAEDKLEFKSGFVHFEATDVITLTADKECSFANLGVYSSYGFGHGSSWNEEIEIAKCEVSGNTATITLDRKVTSCAFSFDNYEGVSSVTFDATSSVVEGPSLQLVGVTPDGETSESWVRALTLSFNKEVYVWSLDFDVRGMNTGEEFYINSHHIGENSDGGFDLTLYLGDANDGWTKMITVPDTYTYTIPAGAIKSVDGEDLPETTITFTVDGTFPVVSYSPVETTSLEQIELTFDKVIEDMTIYYDWWICNEEGDAVAYVDWGSGSGSKTVTLGLNTPITTPGNYSLRIFAGAFTAANNMPNMPTNLTFTVAEDTPAISTDYVMTAQDVKTRVQSQVTLPIEMDNAGEVTAFQFDLYLPEGVAVSYTTEDGEVLYDIELNDDRAKSSHILAAEPQANGSLRIVAYSTSNAAFAGNSGVLVNVGLSVDDIAEGDYQIVMRNIRMVTTDETEKFGADCTVTLTVENLLLGDVNNDGEFSMLDVVMMVNAVLEIEQTNFNAAAADLNGDGVISMVDVVGVLRLVLTGGEAMAPARTARGAEVMPELSAGEWVAMEGGRVALPVALNSRDTYSAFQLDVVLPVGVELAEATLTGRAKASHTIAWNTLADGSVRVVAYAMDNAAFRDNEGVLLNLVLNTSDALSADAMLAVTDGLFATIGGAEHRAADLDVMMRSHTTNVDEAYAVGFHVYGVKGAIEVACGAETVLSIYAVNGKLVQQVVANAGKTRIELPAGVYVVNGDKIIVK